MISDTQALINASVDHPYLISVITLLSVIITTITIILRGKDVCLSWTALFYSVTAPCLSIYIMRMIFDLWLHPSYTGFFDNVVVGLIAYLLATPHVFALIILIFMFEYITIHQGRSDRNILALLMFVSSSILFAAGELWFRIVIGNAL